MVTHNKTRHTVASLQALGFYPRALVKTRTTTKVLMLRPTGKGNPRLDGQSCETPNEAYWVKSTRKEAELLADWVYIYGSKYSETYYPRIPTEEAPAYAQQALKQAKLPLNFNYLGPNHDEESIFAEGSYQGCGKQWAAVKEGKIVATIAMGSCPYGLDFGAFREAARSLLSEFGEVEGGMASCYTWGYA